MRTLGIIVLALALASVAAHTTVAGELGAPVDKQFIATLDGTVQKYVEMLPVGFDNSQPHDILIALHGHNSDRWQFVTGTQSVLTGTRAAAAAHEMIFISPDYRAIASWMGPAAEADMVQLIALLRAQYNVRNVIMCGSSMGGTSAPIFAALHPDLIEGVCGFNGTANMVEFNNPAFLPAIALSYGGTKEQVPEQYIMRSTELVPGQFLSMPVALTVGGKDTDVPPDSMRRLAASLEALNHPCFMMTDNPYVGHSTTYADTVASLDFVINAAAIPEPATLGLLGAGIAGLVLRRRRAH
ncbi:MAG: PEP-CTERM sorting domain-containing protein [Phycisphaerae bacterium]|nr:PEP-CTERM sorting domain-containing protein [Phycisphaerae bacterium]